MPSSTNKRSELKRLARRCMLERGLLPDFSSGALAETAALRAAPRDPDPAIRDLRALLWCSIDNDDSRDLDQLTVAEPSADGETKILVAIADVDAAVAAGSAIDTHARTNTTSVYTAAGIFPMLPEKLSTDLTSLGEDAERLAVVTEMLVDGDGVVTASAVYRAHVPNHAELAYDAVAAWLGGGPSPARLAAVAGLDAQLRLQDRVAQAMRARRAERGALALETPEARPVFDGEVLTDLRVYEKNRAKQLIEDFMIGVNGVSALYLEERNLPSLRRVLRAPERWPRIVELAAHVGESLPAEPDAGALSAFLTRRRKADPDRFADLSVSVVKLLGAGEYELERPGQHRTCDKRQ